MCHVLWTSRQQEVSVACISAAEADKITSVVCCVLRVACCTTRETRGVERTLRPARQKVLGLVELRAIVNSAGVKQGEGQRWRFVLRGLLSPSSPSQNAGKSKKKRTHTYAAPTEANPKAPALRSATFLSIAMADNRQDV